MINVIATVHARAGPVEAWDLISDFEGEWEPSNPEHKGTEVSTDPKPLEQIATNKEVVGPRQITRENAQRYISIQCNVVGRDIGSFVEEAQQVIDREVDLPPGYLVTWGGQFELQQQVNQRLMIVVPVTLLIICLLLFSSFGSLKNAVLILPESVAARWCADERGLRARRMSASAPGPHDRRHNRARPHPASARHRHRQRPLATVVVGGLVSSTILTLLVLPALYKWFSIGVETERACTSNRQSVPTSEST